MSETIKTIDSIQRFLESIWSIFPNMVILQNDNSVLVPLRNNSVEFCNLINNNTIKINVFSQGAFGKVGTLLVTEDSENQNLQTITPSYNIRTQTFVLYESDVIIKMYIQNEPPRWSIERNVFFITDPLSEMIFGGMISYAYDLGICPFFTKYFGGYLCNDNKTSLVTEKASLEFWTLLNRDFKFSNTYPNYIMNLIFQFLYSVFIYKHYFGMVHLDLHLRNVMFSFIHDRNFKLAAHTPAKYIYQGSNLSEKKYILLKVDNSTFICLENIGLLVKIIDFGICLSDLNKSKISSIKRNIKITTLTDGGFVNLTAGTLSETNNSKLNSMDFMYLITHIWETLTKGLDKAAGKNTIDPTARTDNSTLITMLNNFSIRFFRSGQSLSSLSKDPSRQAPFIDNRLLWIPTNRFVGLPTGFEEPINILYGLVQACLNQKFETSLDGKKVTVYYQDPNILAMIQNEAISVSNTLLLDHTSPTSNLFSKFLEQQKIFENQCPINTMETIDCVKNSIKLEISKIQNVIPKSLVNKSFIDSGTVMVDIYSESFRRNLVYFSQQFNYFQLSINPKVKQLNRNSSGALIYQSYQSRNYKSSRDNTAQYGKYIPFVSIHLFEIKSFAKVIFLKNRNLYEAITENNGFFSINGGYSIEQNYIKNLGLSNNALGQPLGFSYSSESNINGTFLSYPATYDSLLSVVVNTGNNIQITRWTIFRDLHKTRNIDVLYIDEDGKKKTIQTLTIEMYGLNGNGAVGTTPIMANGSLMTKQYVWAFITGPILIYNNEVLFTEQKIRNNLLLNNNKILTLPNIQNPYAFSSSDGDDNIYGMKNSNRLMAQNILAVDNNNRTLFFVIEGNTLNAPGIDRIQLVNLLVKFNLNRAVCLDSGVNSNAIFTYCSERFDECKTMMTIKTNTPEHTSSTGLCFI